MKQVFAGTCLAVALAVGLSAQSGQSYPPSAPEKDAIKDAKVVTVTGCVRAGEAPNSFVLANVKWDKDKDAPKDTTGTSSTGTSGSRTAPAGESQNTSASTTLRLVVAAEAPQITNEHVDHTVQITGTLVPQDRSTASSTGTSGTAAIGTGAAGEQTGQRRTSAAEQPQQSLNVRTVTIVSNTCTE